MRRFDIAPTPDFFHGVPRGPRTYRPFSRFTLKPQTIQEKNEAHLQTKNGQRKAIGGRETTFKEVMDYNDKGQFIAEKDPIHTDNQPN